MKKVLLPIIISVLSMSINAQTYTEANRDYFNPDATYITGLNTRTQNIVNAKTYTVANCNSPDCGKSSWTQLLCEMWKVRNNPTSLNTWITGKGKTLINSEWAGNFCGPFSAPGLTMYFFQYKNVLPSSQIDTIVNRLGTTRKFSYRCSPNTGWSLLERPDRLMDPVWTEQNKINEKNSENYHWMLRMAGYVFAETYGDASQKQFYSTFVKNWVRALYNVGRVEWSSNNYWGHTYNPLQVLYMQAQDTNIKKMAKAGLDWMVLENSLHYIDGFQAGADVRAKTDAHKAFAGSIWGYNYMYFADAAHLPSYSVTLSTKTLDDYIGYAPYSNYVPAKAILDLAWRDFPLPVEIQSAKPHYSLDFGDYAAWKGNSDTGKRFEFETIWMDKNLILSSIATNVPDGYQMCLDQRSFWEQSTWRLGVKGTSTGTIQLFGNAGYVHNNSTARHPYEEIAQYHNTMIRLIKEDSITRIWTAAPKAFPMEIIGNNAFVDMGNDVYAAFISHNVLSIDSLKFTGDANYIQYIWRIDSSQLGAVALEVGTKDNYGSYINFKATFNGSVGSFSVISEDVLEYVSTSNNTIRTQYMPLTTYNLIQGCTINNAGVTPKLWANGQYIDYNTWDTYKVSYGKEIIKQVWGSGELQIATNSSAMKIVIDPTTAIPTYYSFNPAEAPIITNLNNKSNAKLEVYPIPSYDYIYINPGNTEDFEASIYDLSGCNILKQSFTVASKMNIASLKSGVYILRIIQNHTVETIRIVKR